MALASGGLNPQAVLDWVQAQQASGPVLIYSTATPDEVQDVQSKLGRMNAGEIVEKLLAEIARALPEPASHASSLPAVRRPERS